MFVLACKTISLHPGGWELGSAGRWRFIQFLVSAQSGERAVEHVESCAVVELNNSTDHVDAATQCART